MIAVTLTSWKKRIGNVLPIIKSLMDNTLKPDAIYLNLSVAEFPNMEKNIPADLVDYFSSDNRLVINWVKGENTKTFKKVFPALKYLKDDDIIIYVDDDFIFPSDFIESRVGDLKKYDRPITGRKKLEDKFGIEGLQRPGANCAAYKKHFKGYEKFLTHEIVHHYEDDQVYLALFLANGTMFKSASKYINGRDLVSIEDEHGISKNVIQRPSPFFNEAKALIRRRFKKLYGISEYDAASRVVAKYAQKK